MGPALDAAVYLTRTRSDRVTRKNCSVSLTQLTPGNGDGVEQGTLRAGTFAVDVTTTSSAAAEPDDRVYRPPAFVRTL